MHKGKVAALLIVALAATSVLAVDARAAGLPDPAATPGKVTGKHKHHRRHQPAATKSPGAATSAPTK